MEFQSSPRTMPPPLASRAGPARGSSRTLQPLHCPHYNRNCNMVAPCCGALVCCHIGHDQGGYCNRKLHLPSVTKLLCVSCGQLQPVGRACRSCSRLFGQKSCIPCRMWYAGDGFHCAKCGVCRLGSASRVRHCDVCRRCFPIGTGAFQHVCAIPRTGASSKQPCAGCGEDTLRSRQPARPLPCGHVMHANCFKARLERNYSCPLRACKKPMVNVDKWKAAAARPAMCKIRCLKCNVTSTVPYSAGVRRCPRPGCRSTSTGRIG